MKRADRKIPRASKEQVLRAADLKAAEVRFVVANYYWSQEARKRADMQLRHIGDKETQEGILSYWGDSMSGLEQDMEKQLASFCDGHPVGRWLRSIHGIGPVISAGLLGYVDIERAQTAGAIWRFAGLDPSCKWEKGQKRPFCRTMKQITWHAGQCFMKTYNSDKSYYGKLYKKRKLELEQANDAGAFAERAKVFVVNSADAKATLAKGKLPAFNIDAQARRYAVKLFLSHFHAVYYWHHFGRIPAFPFAVDIMGHAHDIRVPNSSMFPGFAKSYYGAEINDMPWISNA
jgi:hypothetical protein